ncbi:MAG: hypothetical protein H0U21_05510 [Acidimicrobiia bacterium]|nr:hypothetical protein [Acidimicrobiia bacterium]
MRSENLILSVVCAAGVGVAVTTAWRGRKLPVVSAPMKAPQTAGEAAQDAVRSVSTVLAAGLVAGFLVAGLGGRLLMRILGATSGDRAQGRLTEADEVVGEITFGGSLGFVVFVGLLLPAGASLIYLVVRRFLPDPAWIGGLIFGLLLLATFGVDDPLSSDNVDFRILTPLPLAVTLVVVTALLFGATFAALAARLDSTMGRIADPGWANKIGYVSLVALVVPFFLIPAIVYVAIRVIDRGRIGVLLEQRPIQLAGHALMSVAAIAAALIVLRTTVEIL